MAVAGQKRKRGGHHPYLSGNFAPVQQTRTLTPCTYTGTIPKELSGGQYVRNGGNPVSNEDLGRDAHWFDGDGMLSGVAFTKDHEGATIQPEFVNQFLLTDVYLSTLASPSVRRPILPSIATLTNPAVSLISVCLQVFRTILLAILSCLAGSRQVIKKISVANTAVLYHDGRALATCESGPPLRFQLPGLETVGWYDGAAAEGEEENALDAEDETFGGDGLIGFMKEWTTGHPKVDPITREMILYHGTFIAPYVNYSVLPEKQCLEGQTPHGPRIVNAPVPGVSGAKMMHDFGVSHTHTVIMDLPLSLDPTNLMRGKPVVAYDRKKPSRFGIFPRRDPQAIRWFETKACCIFHTANTWDEINEESKVDSVSMLASRLTSAALVFTAGNLQVCKSISGDCEDAKRPMPFFDKYDYDEAYLNGRPWNPVLKFEEDETFDQAPNIEDPPSEKTPLLIDNVAQAPIVILDPDIEVEQCRLYYYNFDLTTNLISAQYALSILPFEFPSIHPDLTMQRARYIYGCSTSTLTSFGTALGKAAKIDVLLKFDALSLIERGASNPPRNVTGSVDNRVLAQIIADADPQDPIKAFILPGEWFAQEPRFVPRQNAASEDDGFLLFYAFDETQLDSEGEAPPDAVSELWVVDALKMGMPGVGMNAVVARVKLPQRVPYGLHGSWFSEEEIRNQRPVEKYRSTEKVLAGKDDGDNGMLMGTWMAVRAWVEERLG